MVWEGGSSDCKSGVPGDTDEEQQDEGKDPDSSACPPAGAVASASPGALV